MLVCLWKRIDRNHTRILIRIPFMSQILAQHHLQSSLKVSMAYIQQHPRSDHPRLFRITSLDSASEILHQSSGEKKSFAPKSPLLGRRCKTESDMSDAFRISSFRDDFGHAAAETYLITKLAFTLLKFLG